MTHGAPRMPNRRGEGELLREDILAAASRQLSSLDGEDALTIRGVAREAGIAAASIYQHFADRAALVGALSEHEYARLRERMKAADRAAGTDGPVAQVRAQLHAYCAFAVEHPGIYRLMMACGSSRPGPGARRSGPMIDLIDALSVSFQRCAAVRPLRVTAERAAVITFVGAHGRVALSHGSAGTSDLDEIAPFVDELIDLVLA